MCVFSLVCECVSTCVCFLQGSNAGRAVLKGARQLPFTTSGGNKQRGRGSYLPFLLGQQAEEETLLGSHCNYTQLQGEKRKSRQDSLEKVVLATLNSSL